VEEAPVVLQAVTLAEARQAVILAEALWVLQVQQRLE